MSKAHIIPYRPEFLDDVIDLTLKAWAPVFAKTQKEVLPFVYDNFYPKGWEVRQAEDVRNLLRDEPQNLWLALHNAKLTGFIGLRFHHADQMGEIHIIAVSPDHQRQGIGQALLDFADQKFRTAGLKMVMVETGDDSGHQPAKEAYESFGFQRWPVARYFKQL